MKDNQDDAFTRQLKAITGKTMEELKKEIDVIFEGAYILIERVPQ